MVELLVTMPYSPKTVTVGTTGETANEIEVADISAFPDVGGDELGAAVLSTDDRFQSDDPADYETVTYTGKDTGNNKLTGVTREVEGTKREWPDGTAIICPVTAEHIERLIDRIKAHESDYAKDRLWGAI